MLKRKIIRFRRPNDRVKIPACAVDHFEFIVLVASENRAARGVYIF
jgi:hypothetical protein